MLLFFFFSPHYWREFPFCNLWGSSSGIFLFFEMILRTSATNKDRTWVFSLTHLSESIDSSLIYCLIILLSNRRSFHWTMRVYSWCITPTSPLIYYVLPFKRRVNESPCILSFCSWTLFFCKISLLVIIRRIIECLGSSITIIMIVLNIFILRWFYLRL
jgi:hypothetical protein